ncbi:hypothetical protein C8Q80DRAFT_1269512 [Daedaleopsis nitida]|nr:hypothetical protein C8Q80DRAFT_1269512 [Daedaleopsis nitida]
MAHQGGPGTGALGGPPSGHCAICPAANLSTERASVYLDSQRIATAGQKHAWHTHTSPANYKRAVYRPPPKEFYVDVLPPTKFGSGFCYGMRISPIQTDETDNRSTRSGSSHHEYDVWRRWEDCLWFQEILESEYALMARQKRSRLAAGKGVKKNGVYIQSDQAASFESLPPGPDANSIAKDIHPLIPRLTKKGTLFKASHSTIEQRGREFQALIHALFQDDVPMLVKELRETRLVRDFFGYWRRDLDHDRKRQSLSSKGPTNTRHSVASSVFSMYFSASTLSLHQPNNAFADLPRRDEPRRRSTGRVPANYAHSDSSASTMSVASSSRGPPPHSPASQPQDLTFFVSERGSLALNIVDDDERAEYINTPLSAPARVHPHPWTRDPDSPFPSHDEEIFAMPDTAKPRQEPGAGEFHHGLQALPEDSELVPASPANVTASQHSEIEEVPRVPARRPRNNSCPDRTNRQCLFIPAEQPRGAQTGGLSVLDGLHLDTTNSLRVPPARGMRPSPVEGDHAGPRSPTTASSSSRTSSVALSNFSYCTDQSSRSSWRTSIASEKSYTQSFATSFANGSCAEFDRQSQYSFATSFANGSCADFDRGRTARHSIASLASATSSGRQTALDRRDSMTTLSSFLSDLSLDSSMMGLSVTPPPSGSLRRSLSAGSRRPTSILATLGGQEDWYEQQEDLLDAYFYDPGMHATMPPMRLEERPRTPLTIPAHGQAPTPQSFRMELAAPPTPDRFPKPFQNRPPGQFHLPWSQPSTPIPCPARPSTSGGIVSIPSSPGTISSAGSPPGSPQSTTVESITLKAVLQESIVLLRISRTAPLEELRTRLRDKFAVQEGVQLSSAFAIGWAPQAGGPRAGGGMHGRPRSNSASSVGSMNPHALRYVYEESEWRAAVAACAGGKMTIRLFNAQPI